MANKSFAVENPQGLTDAIFALDEVASESVLRQAAVAGARVVMNEAKLRGPVLNNNFNGKDLGASWERYGTTYYPGFLRDHIIIAHDKEASVPGRIASYIVTWTKEAFYGRFGEHGTSKMSAKPFLRPSYEATKQEVAHAIDDVIQRKVTEANHGQ